MATLALNWKVGPELTKRRFCTQVAAVVVAGVMLVTTTACSKLPNWLNVAVQDMPMALSIAAGVISLATINNPNATATDIAGATKISGFLTAGLQEIQNAYNAWKQNKTAGNQQAILAVANQVVSDLPNELNTVQIMNPVLRAQISNAAAIILNMIEAFLSLVPSQTATVAARRAARGVGALPWARPGPKDLQNAWNQKVCAGNGACMALVASK